MNQSRSELPAPLPASVLGDDTERYDVVVIGFGIAGGSAALEAARAGQITLLPPTAVTLAELAAYQDVEAILGERRMITPLLPKVVVEDERAWLAMPHPIEYPL